jgi:hypothetical protein
MKHHHHHPFMGLWALDASVTLVKICPASVEVRPRSRYYDANGSIRQMGCRSGLQGSCSCRTPSIPRALASRRLRFLPRVKWYVFLASLCHGYLDLRCTKGKLETGYHPVYAERRPRPQAKPHLQEAWRPSIVGGRAGTGQGRAGQGSWATCCAAQGGTGGPRLSSKCMASGAGDGRTRPSIISCASSQFTLKSLKLELGRQRWPGHGEGCSDV